MIWLLAREKLAEQELARMRPQLDFSQKTKMPFRKKQNNRVQCWEIISNVHKVKVH